MNLQSRARVLAQNPPCAYSKILNDLADRIDSLEMLLKSIQDEISLRGISGTILTDRKRQSLPEQIVSKIYEQGQPMKHSDLLRAMYHTKAAVLKTAIQDSLESGMIKMERIKQPSGRLVRVYSLAPEHEKARHAMKGKAG